MPNYDDKISEYFTWHEALWLPSWGRHGKESDGLTDVVRSNLTALFKRLDLVRDFFGAALNVHVAWRPNSYNELVNGAKNSAHLASGNDAACDFDVRGLSCDAVKLKILGSNSLAAWNLRMEDNGKGAKWIHLDSRIIIPGHSRFFKP